jgi:predicted anti-sigma-YlaC factor YlaD
MECLSADRIYGLLDGGLSPEERAAIESHLAACPVCRAAFETRRRIEEAAGSLPAFEVPPDFAASVMSRLEAAPSPARGRRGVLSWVIAAAAAGFGLGGVFVLIATLAGLSLSEAFAQLNGFLWGAVRSAAFHSIKGMKIIVLGGTIIVRVIGYALETLRTMMSLIGPEIQAFVVGMAVLVLVAGGLWLGLGRGYFLAEKTHEK